MSIAAYTLATRNHLRFYLENFYDNDLQSKRRNCKAQLDEHPTADCGQEFISLYGDYHKPNTPNTIQAIDENFGITVAISRKISLIPQDYRGELGYFNAHTVPLTDIVGTDDYDRFYASWVSLEQRCREIVGLVAGEHRGILMQAANALLTDGGYISEPLLWKGTDARPTQVGPDHFYGYQDNPPHDADPIFGLMMKIHFGDAVRFQAVEGYA